MAAMSEAGRRDPKAGDVSEVEQEDEPEAEERTEEDIGVKLLKAVIGASSKPRVEIAAYNGGLNMKELVDWINSVDKHFDFFEVPKDKKFKFAVTRLNIHALLWWDGVQVERRRLHKQPIKIWSRMITKLKEKFIPKDYELALYRQM